MKVVCCVCRTIIKDGEEPASHTYCKVCAAALFRQMDIWDLTKKEESNVCYSEQAAV
jgi:hypothetical protein